MSSEIIFFWHFIGIIMTMVFSKIVPMTLERYGFKLSSIDSNTKKQSKLIGLCENIIIYLFIIKSETTGLGFVFAAKALARNDDSKDEMLQSYFLAGTLVNFTYTILMASFFKYLENDFVTRIQILHL